MAYLLDANVFIQAKNLQYGFDFCPAFWDWLTEAHGAGRLRSIRHVGDELSGFGDELSAWADGLDEAFFVPPDAAVLAAAQGVSAWVLQQGYEPAAVNTFLQVADFWLVAAALAGNHTVVTHEVASPSAKKIKIPNVCVGLGWTSRRPTRCCARSRRGSCSGRRKRGLDTGAPFESRAEFRPILPIFANPCTLHGMSTMNISLPDTLKDFVDTQVGARGFGTSSEYVRELIRRDQDRVRLRELLLAGAASQPGEPATAAYFEALRARAGGAGKVRRASR